MITKYDLFLNISHFLMCFLWDQEDAAEGAMGKGLCHQVGSKVAATSPCLAASKAWFLAPAAETVVKMLTIT